MVIAAKGQSSLEETLSECRGNSADVEDPLYGCQWHLKNTGQFIYSGKRITSGEDINVEGVWNEDVYGSGINVAIVSDGIDLSHEDLSANVRSGLNYDLSDSSSFSGTRAAGVIAATGYNGLGVRGTAPGASIYSYRLSGDLSEADAVVRNKEITAVSVNGRGSEDGAFFQEASSSWEEGVELGISKGFYGKGVFYVRGAGDGHESGDQANFNEYSSYYGVTAVCSTDGYGKKSIFSEEGVNLWVCAPGSDIVTTDNNNDYVVTSGTFLSASQVGGVAALLREINGDLSWRDIKLILAGSARQNDIFDLSWETGAVKYGSDVERYNYNPKYGFGVVDAEAAAELAGSWKGVGEMRTVTAFSDNEITIPYGEGNGEGEADGVLVSRLMIPDVEEIFTEFVEVELVLSCDCLQDLNIKLTSPSGTVSELVREFSGEEEDADISYLRRTHRFGSARHLGEDPAGEWNLKISDTASGDEEDTENTVTLHSWSIKVYGHVFLQDFGKEIITKAFSLGSISNKTYREGVQITPLVLPEATGTNLSITYSLSPAPPAGLTFDKTTRTISGTPTAVGRTRHNYRASIPGQQLNRNFHITVENNPPTFGSETIPKKRYIQGTNVGLPVTLPAATGGNGTLNYSLTPSLPTGLEFNPATRVISGTPTDIIQTPGRLYTYKVTDSDGDIDSLSFRIEIFRDQTPTFSGVMVDDQVYTAGVQITPLELPRSILGNSPSHSITPELPDGLIIETETGGDGGMRRIIIIRGTPTTAMPETEYTWRVRDTDGDTDELTFSITVLAEPNTEPTFGSETIDNKVYINGEAVMETLPEATSGNAPLTYSLTNIGSTALTLAVDFDKNTRVLSGTPNVNVHLLPITRAYTYKVTDNDGDTAEITFSITIEEDSEPDFSVTTIEDQVYMGRSIRLPVATGGNAPLVYSITPPLPPGLRLDRDTGVISGTPASASSERTYTYTVMDRDGDIKELTFRFSAEVPSTPGPGPTRTSGSDPGGGGGGCAVSDQSSAVSDIPGVMACLILIPVSVLIRRKGRARIRTWQ